ncbi:MAG: HRDC domain-containing protein [Candidatus Omnitrophica bacterium]|nr:HRDC domain-containing protein [Candidatus Omnitrophota bacterium]
MKFIERQDALTEVVEALSASEWVALDTEADSLHHYVEKLCLLQLSVPAGDFVLDTLVGLDWKPLLEALSRKLLIIHGADFDLRMLRRAHGFVPSGVFDTMIAAQLLGYEKQGLADLALRHCGVHLSKAAQKADWSRRPLKEDLLAYAANDTHYLESIWKKMEEELTALGRRRWHTETCERLIQSVSVSKEEVRKDRPAWQVKGSALLKGRALTILKELWHWREERAKVLDRPAFKVLNSEYLIQAARWASEHAGEDIGLMPDAPRNIKGELREPLNEVLKKAQTAPLVEFSKPRRGSVPNPWTETSKQRFLALKSIRDAAGNELKIQPSLLATNAVLEVVALKNPKTFEDIRALDCLMSWQLEVLAEKLLKPTSA